MPRFDVQAFLDRRSSGLARVRLPRLLADEPASRVIERAADAYGVRAQYLLTVLEAEQNLVSDRTVRNPSITIYSLPDKPLADGSKPTPRYGGFVVRNGGTRRRPSDGKPATPDGNWYVEVVGDKKMAFAAGAGIPDEKEFPSWDVRDYLGFETQVRRAAMLASRDLDTWGRFASVHPDRRTPEDYRKVTVTLYGGEQVVPASADAFVLLRYTPDPRVLIDRPRIERTIV